ncbi:MAG: thiamine-monophosphate kinase, partial [Bdellovibrionales bacterium]|nr:thiamine-monophosphate kinase [Bdellovibrionales bacterium]
MLLSDFGGEFAFLRKITETSSDSRVIVGNGDDAAVFEMGGTFIAVSTDTIVEGDHFSLTYFTPRQIGIKSVEASASDIVAMGGRPEFLFFSLCVPRDLPVEVLDGMYDGIREARLRLGAEVHGGDMTHGSQFIVSVTVMGSIEKREFISPRSGAKAGDLIYVTGPLGGSTAGLRLFQTNTLGFEDVKRKHCEPRCRIDVVNLI